MQLRYVVAIDEVQAVGVCREPLAVCAVNDDLVYVQAREQIVGEVCAVVAWHLDLCERVAARSQGRGCEHGRSHVGAYPDVVVGIFHCAAHIEERRERCEVLVYERGVAFQGLGGGVIAQQGGLYPVVVGEPQQAVVVEEHLAQSVKRTLEVVGEQCLVV